MTDHPFIRQAGNRRAVVVLVGKDRRDPADEVHAWSSKFVRDVGLLFDDGWLGTRSECERDLAAVLVKYSGSNFRLTAHPISVTRHTATRQAMIGERVIDLLITDGVLRMLPQPHDIISRRLFSTSSGKPRYRVDVDRRDEWVGERLLVMIR